MKIKIIALTLLTLTLHIYGKPRVTETVLNVPGHQSFPELQSVKFVDVCGSNGTFAFFSDKSTSEVYVFQNTDNLGTWNYFQTIKPEDSQSGDGFGAAIDYEPVTNAVIIGAPYKNAYAGAVYVYRLDRDNNNTWTYFSQYNFNATVPNTGAFFGYSVKIGGYNPVTLKNSAYCDSRFNHPCYSILVGVPGNELENGFNYVQELYLVNSRNATNFTANWVYHDQFDVPAKYMTNTYSGRYIFSGKTIWDENPAADFTAYPFNVGQLFFFPYDKSTSVAICNIWTLSTRKGRSGISYSNPYEHISGFIANSDQNKYSDFGHTVVSSQNFILARNVKETNGSSDLFLYSFNIIPTTNDNCFDNYNNKPSKRVLTLPYDDKLGDDIPGKPIDIYGRGNRATILKAEKKQVSIIEVNLNDASMLTPSLLITTALLITTLIGL